jgi:hypothetical protein
MSLFQTSAFFIVVNCALAQTAAIPDDEGRALMRQVVAYCGGGEGLRTLKAVQWRFSERHYVGYDKGPEADTIRLIEFPNKSHMRVMTPGGATRIFDGTNAYALQAGKMFDLSSIAASLLSDVQRDPINVLLHVDDPAYEFKIVPGVKKGANSTVVAIRVGTAQSRWSIETATGKLLAIEQDSTNSVLAGNAHEKLTVQGYKKFGKANLPARFHVDQDLSHAYQDAVTRGSGRLGGLVGGMEGRADLSLEKLNPDTSKLFVKP